MIETLFKYSIAVSITLVIAWICYRMALGKDNRFKVDRAIVLAIYAAALLMLPLTMLLQLPQAIFVYGDAAAGYSQSPEKVDRLQALADEDYAKNNAEAILKARYGESVKLTYESGEEPVYYGFKHCIEPDYKLNKDKK